MRLVKLAAVEHQPLMKTRAVQSPEKAAEVLVQTPVVTMTVQRVDEPQCLGRSWSVLEE